jgi:prophage antirepressor-like protein
MSELQVFEGQGFSVRTTIKNGEPWFVASDVCQVLEISDIRQAMDRLDEDERGGCRIPTPGGEQEVRAVSEAGLYSLVLGSRKPEAKTFKRWVTHEVLPAIRRTGTYSTKHNPFEIENARLRGLIEGLTMQIGRVASHPFRTEPQNTRTRIIRPEAYLGTHLANHLAGKTETSMDEIFRDFAEPAGIQRDHGTEILVGRALHASGWHPHQVRADGGRERIYRR